MGYRKVLVFYRGSAPKGVKTNWIMHEFRVAEPPPEPPRRTGVNDMRVRIYQVPFSFSLYCILRCFLFVAVG